MKKLIQKIKYYLKSVRNFKDCKYASCWDGSNAQRRMMNMLSPHMPDAKFKEYINWMKARGCDTAHLVLINDHDGEYAGYNCANNSSQAKLAKDRIKKLYLEGFAIVPWIITDDSSSSASWLFSHTAAAIEALAKAELFEHASYVVLGLEMNEYGNAKQWGALATEIRKHYKGKLGTHHTSGNSFPFAGLGEIVLGQLDPKNANAKTIAAQIAAINSIGKYAVGFEYSRNPNNNLAKSAMNSGAIGVGNW